MFLLLLLTTVSPNRFFKDSKSLLVTFSLFSHSFQDTSEPSIFATFDKPKLFLSLQQEPGYGGSDPGLIIQVTPRT